MPSQILCKLNYFNGANAKNPDLLSCLYAPRHRVWPFTGNQQFDKILDQRLFVSADNAVKHFENEHYESAIAMCATAAEMLTYVLFFIHTDSFEIPTENDFSTQSKFKRLKDVVDGTKGITFKNSFSDEGNQSKRLAVLRASKIKKSDYGTNGEGHDTAIICDLLDKIHFIRIKYLHHWIHISDSERKKDAEECICWLYDAMGHTFEMDPSDEAGVLKINASIVKWVQKFTP
jgi:hypothetical protein